MPNRFRLFYVTTVVFISSGFGFYIQDKLSQKENKLHDEFWKSKLLEQLQTDSGDPELKNILFSKSV
ncbi:hypothetical protein HMI54_004664 [Coelomomyces lativittatus]|nr:hypothetical protein HMI54_004664 [Coelomomyces lativittatus]KAJ1515308.1 hypothetical protein HMI56_005868 [Coelomomyces lativittatus]KAJ1517817.1 hypothetical protein HMI55_005782 [Coelomomyces lativittatus]